MRVRLGRGLRAVAAEPLVPQECISNDHHLQIFIEHRPVPLTGRQPHRECPHSSSPLSRWSETTTSHEHRTRGEPPHHRVDRPVRATSHDGPGTPGEGLRKGELMALTIDAVVQIGSAYWLRVPVGKLHNDRYIPLHPQLKTLLDDWLADRPAGLRSDLIFLDWGRPIPPARVDRALTRIAAAAGIAKITAHQLRHTLATQAINRGMSLEAIAALLGHRTMTMTMVYAKIADRAVADEYFAVSEKVEALYNRAAHLPADAEGAEMLKLRREMNSRMLGNGHCARPVEMDCHFESICESCTFFVTTIEFRPTLQRQREDAAAKGQVGRQKIFDGILERLDNEAS